MPHARTWQKILAKSFGNSNSARLLAKAGSIYEGYWDLIPQGIDRANRRILQDRVYLGLSIYRSLMETGGDPQTVLCEIEPLFRQAFVSRLIPGIRILNLLPDPFPIVRYVMRKMAFGPGGVYEQELVADTRDTFAFNTHRCLIYDTLNDQDAGELTTLFCSTDDWLAAALPKVSWERTQTLGRGGDCCDFRWSRNS